MTTHFIDEINSGSKTAVLKKEILCYYTNNGENSLSELSKEMGVSVPTITKLVTELIEEGFVIDYGKQESTGGRRPNMYGLNEESAYFVGVDIRRRSINLGLINFRGELIDNLQYIPFVFENTHGKFDNLCQIIENYLDNVPVKRSKIIHIAINIAGRVNTSSGYSYSFFYFNEKPLTEIFEERLHTRVSIDNDSRAMAYGEYMHGVGQNKKNLLYLNISWGLGLGMVLNGELYYGKSGYAGEFGHYPVFDNDVLCHCGKKGCLETEVSGLYLYRMLVEKVNAGESSILAKRIKKNEDLRVSDIVKAALKDDVLAIELIEEIGTKLGKPLAGLINIFNPEMVVIGGVLAEAGDYLLLPLRSSVKKYSLNLVSSDTLIVPTKLGEKAGVIGACLLARSKTLGLINS